MEGRSAPRWAVAHPVDVALNAIDLDSHMRAKLPEASTCADTLRSSIEVDWGEHRLLACLQEDILQKCTGLVDHLPLVPNELIYQYLHPLPLPC